MMAPPIAPSAIHMLLSLSRARRTPPASCRTHSIADHAQPVGAGLTAPGLAGATEHLAHIGASFVAGEGRVFLGLRIEALDGVRRPVRRPDSILVVDIDRVGAGLALRHRIGGPYLRRRIVATAPAAMPKAHPKEAFGIRPDAARTDALAWRIDHGGL